MDSPLRAVWALEKFLFCTFSSVWLLKAAIINKGSLIHAIADLSVIKITAVPVSSPPLLILLGGRVINYSFYVIKKEFHASVFPLQSR